MEREEPGTVGHLRLDDLAGARIAQADEAFASAPFVEVSALPWIVAKTSATRARQYPRRRLPRGASATAAECPALRGDVQASRRRARRESCRSDK